MTKTLKQYEKTLVKLLKFKNNYSQLEFAEVTQEQLLLLTDEDAASFLSFVAFSKRDATEEDTPEEKIKHNSC